MSSVSGVAAVGAQQPQVTGTAQKTNPFQELQDAINSGDLSQAQQIYSQIASNAPSGGPAQSSQIGQDFAAIGQALQSGNVNTAQSALATFQGDVKKAGGGHHHHHHGGGAPPATDPTATTGTSTPALPTDTTGNNVNTVV